MDTYWHLRFELNVALLAKVFERTADKALPLVSQLMEDVGNSLIRQNVNDAFQFPVRPGGQALLGQAVGVISMAQSAHVGVVAPGRFSFGFVLPTYTIKHPETISRLLNGLFKQIARKLDAHAVNPQPFPWKFEDATGQPVGQIEASALDWLTPPKLLAFEGVFTRSFIAAKSMTVHAASKDCAEELLRQGVTADGGWVTEDDTVDDAVLRTISAGMEIVPVAPNPNEQALHVMLDPKGKITVTLSRMVMQEITIQVAADTIDGAREELRGLTTGEDAAAVAAHASSWRTTAQMGIIQESAICRDGVSVFTQDADEAKPDAPQP
jgi:hypothetical protein